MPEIQDISLLQRANDFTSRPWRLYSALVTPRVGKVHAVNVHNMRTWLLASLRLGSVNFTMHGVGQTS